MTRDARRTAMLLGALAVVAALVVIDRLAGAPGAETDEPEAPALSLADRHRDEAVRTAEVAAVVETGEQWDDALAEAEIAWRDASSRMIRAGSADIAFARLREVVEASMRDLGLRLDASSALPVETPMEGEALRVIGMRLDFQAFDPQAVHRLVDRLENLPEVRTNVASLRVTGPGRTGRPSASVTIDLRALAWIGPEV